jgi:hypothetical protein
VHDREPPGAIHRVGGELRALTQVVGLLRHGTRTGR